MKTPNNINQERSTSHEYDNTRSKKKTRNSGSAKRENLNKGRKKKRRIKRREKKLSKSKFIESKDKNLKNSFSSFDRAKETFGFSMKRRYIVPQIGIYPFNSVSLAFIF